MQKTESDNSNSSGLIEKTNQTVVVSPELRGTVVEACSRSMSLIDDTNAHLSALMKGLGTNSPSPEMRHLDQGRVNAACNCAKQMSNMMRLKLDAVRILMELNKNESYPRRG